MAGTSSQPPVETMAAIFSETNYSAGLDVEALDRVAKYFIDLAPRRSTAPHSVVPIDPGILIHQIPGGMISNFRSQLQMQKALDKLPQVLQEVSRVREDLGYPPLVTPTSQIVGTQAVMNIISGERYKIVPNEVKDYVKGLYGRSPVPIDKGMIKKILGDDKPINYRPADKIAPMLPKATDGVDPALINAEEDILSYVLLPEPALEYFKWRAAPAGERPEIPADAEIRKAKGEAAAKGAVVDNVAQTPVPSAQSSMPMSLSTPPSQLPVDGLAAELIGKIDGLVIEEIVFRKGDSTISVKSSAAPQASAARQTLDVAAAVPLPSFVASPQQMTQSQPQARQQQPAPQVNTAAAATYKQTIKAPIVGTFYSSPGPGKPAFVKEGDIVEKGAKVCIVEAMKLFNEISAPARCKIVKILAADGTSVDKDQELIGIEEVG
jgi:oxaloacetate decarboxylase alpha subunit